MPDTYNYTVVDDKHVQVSTCIVCLVIIVYGLIGNIKIGHKVLRDKSKWTVTNVLITNLAVANILISIFVVPSFLVHLFVEAWPFGSIVCHLWPCIYYSVSYASMLTLASIVQVRCWFTIHSSAETIMNRRMMIVSVVIIWFVSIAWSLPYGIFAAQHNRAGVTYCYIIWPNFDYIRNYSIATLIVMLVLPIVSIVYSVVTRFLQKSTTDSSSQMVTKSRTIRGLIAFFAVFAIYWLTPHIIDSLTEWEVNEWKYIQIILRLLQVVAVSSMCFTPLFYMWLNKITNNNSQTVIKHLSV